MIQEKLKLRLKILEEGLQGGGGYQKPEKTNSLFGILSSNGGLKRRSSSQPRASRISNSDKEKTATSNGLGELKRSSSMKKIYASESFLRKSLWAPRNKVVGSVEKENTNSVNNSCNNGITESGKVKNKVDESDEAQNMAMAKAENNGDGDDMVSGFLYDRLQKEVISLRKTCEAKDTDLNAKDEEIKVNKIDLSVHLKLSVHLNSTSIILFHFRCFQRRLRQWQKQWNQSTRK